MLSSLKLTNFTVFTQATMSFSPGLNVIIGENGTGKTHLLKTGFMAVNAWPILHTNGKLPGKEKTAEHFALQLQQLFKPDLIGSLNNHSCKAKTYLVAEVSAGSDTLSWAVNFTAKAESKVNIDDFPTKLPIEPSLVRAVYLPSKEMVSFFEGFIALTDRHDLPFDSTYRELALNLSSPLLKEQPFLLKQQLSKLSEKIGGRLQLDGGRFYWFDEQGNKHEVSLLAEGTRKIATLFHLIANGSLAANATLFWDEPEANLNPKLVKIVAQVIWSLVSDGIQVILATHSLFLLRELEILSHQQPFSTHSSQVFALSKTSDGVMVNQGDSVEDVDPLVLLDEELEQSDRYLALDQ